MQVRQADCTTNSTAQRTAQQTSCSFLTQLTSLLLCVLSARLLLWLSEAMNFNFGLAALTSGECIMRFDDTNPEAEKLDYIEQILNNLQWLGHQPARITYSSDYFPQLYDLAVKLIRSGLAYVDHQTAEDIKKSRDYKEGEKTASPWRDRPIEESPAAV